RRESGDLEAERIERRPEQDVVLEAVAAAAVAQELLLQRRQVEPDRTAQERVEILERDRERMPEVEAAQRLQRRRARSAVADTPEVGVEIERVAHRGVSSACRS